MGACTVRIRELTGSRSLSLLQYSLFTNGLQVSAIRDVSWVEGARSGRLHEKSDMKEVLATRTLVLPERDQRGGKETAVQKPWSGVQVESGYTAFAWRRLR